jgi:CAAX protease family protein
LTASDSNGGVSGIRWRENRWLAIAEFGVVALLYVADFYRLIPVSKTPFLFALGWTSLRLRGAGWRSVGFTKPRNWGNALAFGCVAGVGLVLLELFVSYPVLTRLTGRPPDLSDFQPLVGNLGLFLLALVSIWLLAVLGEELVYRGYLMNRVADLGRGTQAAWIVSLILVSTVFGAGHNLVVPIVAHGVGNTVDLFMIYLGRYPGI